jgi:hypothetical protein
MRDHFVAAFLGFKQDGPGRLRRIGRGERGASLVAVMALTSAVLLVGGALFIFGIAEHDLATFQAEEAKSFYLAEAGIQRTDAYLVEQLDAGQEPANGGFTGEPLGNGDYTTTFTKVTGAGLSLARYNVVSVGEVNGVKSEIHVTMNQETFAKYLWFTDHANFPRWFTSGDRLDGLVHCNNWIRIDGDPWFGDEVSTFKDEIRFFPWSNPTFERGYEVSADQIPIPNRNKIRTELRNASHPGGLRLAVLSGAAARYEIVLARNGANGFFSWREYSKSKKKKGGYGYGPWNDENIAAMNGLVWVEDTVWVEGTLDGRLTIGAEGDICIQDDLLYLDSTPGSGPNPGCDDMLGLVSRSNIIVSRTGPNNNDCEIHAAMIALQSSFEPEDLLSGGPRGDLIVYGSITQHIWGHISEFVTAGVLTHGYNRDFHYDPRMRDEAPPFYPETGAYVITRWEEVLPSS